MTKKFLAVMTFMAMTCIAFGQTPFYTYSHGTMSLGDTLNVKSLQFKMKIDDLERFEDDWIDGLEDLADDVEKTDWIVFATQIEVPEESEHYYNAYSKFTDLHDSVMIQIAFLDSNGFVNKSAENVFSGLERASKRYITTIYKEYREEDLEEAEEAFDDAEEKVEDITDEIESKEKNILRKRQQIDENLNSISIARQSLAAVIDQIGQQRQTLARIPGEEEGRREDAEREIRRLENQREGLQDDVNDWNEENFDLEKEIGNIQSNIADAQHSLAIARTELESARAAYDALRLEVASYRTK